MTPSPPALPPPAPPPEPPQGAAPPPCVVIDTQLLLDWLVFDEPACQPWVAALCSGQLRWIASPWMQAECERTLRRSMLQRWSPDPQRVAAAWARWAVMHADPATQPRLRCRDPDDQAFLDLALAHRANALLTRDRDLLVLRRRAAAQGLWIGRPGDWPDLPLPATGPSPSATAPP